MADQPQTRPDLAGVVASVAMALLVVQDGMDGQMDPGLLTAAERKLYADFGVALVQVARTLAILGRSLKEPVIHA